MNSFEKKIQELTAPEKSGTSVQLDELNLERHTKRRINQILKECEAGQEQIEKLGLPPAEADAKWAEVVAKSRIKGLKSLATALHVKKLPDKLVSRIDLKIKEMESIKRAKRLTPAQSPETARASVPAPVPNPSPEVSTGKDQQSESAQLRDEAMAIKDRMFDSLAKGSDALRSEGEERLKLPESFPPSKKAEIEDIIARSRATRGQMVRLNGTPDTMSASAKKAYDEDLDEAGFAIQSIINRGRPHYHHIERIHQEFADPLVGYDLPEGPRQEFPEERRHRLADEAALAQKSSPIETPSAPPAPRPAYLDVLSNIKGQGEKPTESNYAKGSGAKVRWGMERLAPLGAAKDVEQLKALYMKYVNELERGSINWGDLIDSDEQVQKARQQLDSYYQTRLAELGGGALISEITENLVARYSVGEHVNPVDKDGNLLFSESPRILGITTHEGKLWYQVEGTKTSFSEDRLRPVSITAKSPEVAVKKEEFSENEKVSVVPAETELAAPTYEAALNDASFVKFLQEYNPGISMGKLGEKGVMERFEAYQFRVQAADTMSADILEIIKSESGGIEVDPFVVRRSLEVHFLRLALTDPGKVRQQMSMVTMLKEGEARILEKERGMEQLPSLAALSEQKRALETTERGMLQFLNKESKTGTGGVRSGESQLQRVKRVISGLRGGLGGLISGEVLRKKDHAQLSSLYKSKLKDIQKNIKSIENSISDIEHAAALKASMGKEFEDTRKAIFEENSVYKALVDEAKREARKKLVLLGSSGIKGLKELEESQAYLSRLRENPKSAAYLEGLDVTGLQNEFNYLIAGTLHTEIDKAMDSVKLDENGAYSKLVEIVKPYATEGKKIGSKNEVQARQFLVNIISRKAIDSDTSPEQKFLLDAMLLKIFSGVMPTEVQLREETAEKAPAKETLKRGSEIIPRKPETGAKELELEALKKEIEKMGEKFNGENGSDIHSADISAWEKLWKQRRELEPDGKYESGEPVIVLNKRGEKEPSWMFTNFNIDRKGNRIVSLRRPSAFGFESKKILYTDFIKWNRSE